MDLNSFENELKNIVPNLTQKYKVPGVSIGIIDNGKKSFSYFYGLADKKNNVYINENTCFQVGSISKLVTAWVIMSLVEKGKLNLDEPIENYLTRWKFKKGKFDKDKVTARLILGHAAGLSVSGYLGCNPKKELLMLEESLSGKSFMIPKLKVIYEPGLKVKYSGGGYTLLQLVIEEITKDKFSKHAKESILKPLNMCNSTFEFSEVNKENLAIPYGLKGWEVPNYLYTEQAAAGLYSNINDLMNLAIANMQQESDKLYEKYVLSNDSLKILQKRVIRSYPNCFGIDSFNCSENKVLISRGVNRGWRSELIIIPKKRQGLVILSNSDYGNNVINEVTELWLGRILDSMSNKSLEIMDLKNKNIIEKSIRYIQFIKG